MSVSIDPVKVEIHQSGAYVTVRGFVPLPQGPLPTREEQKERFHAAISQLQEALPELIPLYVLEGHADQTKDR